LLVAALGIGCVGVVLGVGWLLPESPARLRAEAESAVRAGDWGAALGSWRKLNATSAATGATHLAEARACLSMGRAAQAEQSLRRAIAADPVEVEGWKLLLEILRVEDRTLEAQEVGWAGSERVSPESRRVLLGQLTLALLADLTDERVRTSLRRWIDADPEDVDARVALLQRIATQPRAADPDRDARLAELEAIVASRPEHLGAREALATALADAGEPERGRAVLDDWPGPESGRDARYWRLRGRWDLEYDRRPERAVDACRKAVAGLPQDWRSWSRLARALRVLGRDDEAAQAAQAVGRLREVLDPLTLGPRLDAALAHRDDPAALRELGALAARAGLDRLADAWRAEARIAAGAAR
jgi:thioredoxin-like negative regulator of GroEL